MDEERIAVFLDYENLAIGARDSLGGLQFDFGPIAEALAERGRVVSRRAYADWSMFDEDRRMLTRNHVELIEIPQRMGMVRKNAADIKMAVDAIEQAFERAYVTTFVVCTGDSDFTPLVHKLRELNKRVIGVGVKGSTSKMLPPACDEFLFYENLEGVEPRQARPAAAEKEPTTVEAAPEEETDTDQGIESIITRTLAGLQRSSGDTVLASSLKRAVLRKDSTFSEADFGYRGFGELLADLAQKGVIELS
ncbi:MAG: NYN domain-containing protein, partial [Acidimicrobiia bacterium]